MEAPHVVRMCSQWIDPPLFTLLNRMNAMTVTSNIDQNEDFPTDLTRGSLNPNRTQRKLKLIHAVVLASLGAAISFAILQFNTSTLDCSH